MVLGAITLRGIENLDCSAPYLFVFIADKFDDGVDHPGPADFRKRVPGARANPPVVVLDRAEQVLDRIFAAYLIEDFDCSATGVFGLILERRDEKLDRIRVVGLDQHVDGLALDVQIGIREDAGNLFYVYFVAARANGAQRCAAHHLVRILELHLERLVDLGLVELGEQVHQVDLDDRVLAAHAGDQVGHHVGPDRVLDDLEDRRLFLRVAVIGALQQLVNREVLLVHAQYFDQGGFGNLLVVEEFEQAVGVVIGAAGQRPGRTRNDPIVAVRETFAVHLEIPVIDERPEDVDENHRV